MKHITVIKNVFQQPPDTTPECDKQNAAASASRGDVNPAQRELPDSVFLTERQSFDWHFFLHDPIGSGHSVLLSEVMSPCTGGTNAQQRD